MRDVSVDTGNKTVTAQGGALWANVYAAAEKHGLAVVGGTVDTTGVGGLTLGGGYGYLAGERGMVIDNLLEVDIVLADGSIVMASVKENEDLFWVSPGTYKLDALFKANLILTGCPRSWSFVRRRHLLHIPSL
jgi:FAD/FMN-containing dehydrogenase